jgi:hypothetical protein
MHNMPLKSIGKICKKYAKNMQNMKQYAGFDNNALCRTGMQYAKYAKKQIETCTICKICKRHFQ